MNPVRYLLYRCYFNPAATLLILLLFTLCPVNAKEKRASSEDIFLQAETQYRSGQHLAAKSLYEQFLNKLPSAKKAAWSYYRLGSIEQKSGAHASALRFYQNLISQYPGSELGDRTTLQMGICYFELGRYTKAEEKFQHIQRFSRDAKRRWQALLYLAKVDAEQHDYTAAIEKLMQTLNQDKSAWEKSRASGLLKQIIDEKLKPAQLVSLADRYQGDPPGDMILLKLQSNYRAERNHEEYQNALMGFLRLFPGHPEVPHIQNALAHVGDSQGIKLGAILPLTGKLALTGQQVLQGAQLAVNRLNQNGVENVSLVVKDSAAGKPVAELVDELASDPDVLGIIGPVQSGEVKTVAPMVEKHRIPIFTSTASSTGLTELSPYIFRNALTRRTEARFLAQHAVNQLHLRRFAILYPLETFGQELRDIFQKEVESMGGEVVVSVSYERSQTDFKEQILQLGGISDDRLVQRVQDQVLGDQPTTSLGREGVLSRPRVDMGNWSEGEIKDMKASLELGYDALFIPGFYDKVGLILPQLVFYNIENLTLLGSRGWNSPELVKLAGNYLSESVFLDGFFAGADEPEVRKFVSAYQQTFGEDPGIYSAQAYDAAAIFIQAVHAGATNRKMMLQALGSVRDFSGASGVTTILEDGDSEKKLFALTVRDKKIVLAHPVTEIIKEDAGPAEITAP